MHFNWKYPKYIKSIEIGNIKYRVPKGILFRNEELEKILKIKSIDKVRQKMGGGIENFIVNIILNIYLKP